MGEDAMAGMRIANTAVLLAALCLAALASPSHASTFFFFQGANGGLPDGQLTAVNGTFYGTTRAGGAHGFGTVFSVTGTTVHVIYDFQGGTGDGERPEANLVAIGNVLYGTTRGGGAFGGGTVFSVSTFGGPDHLLHSFGAGADGINPVGGLINIGTDLYGTTAEGGTGTNCPNTTSYTSCGTVFRVSACVCAVYSVLYSFKGHDQNDGGVPYSTLTYRHQGNADWLYGTTSQGGQGGANCPSQGCGTIFRLPLAGGSDTILHSFAGGTDGQNPYSTGGLIVVGSNLYGTTYYGGNSYGTVFREPLSGGPDQVLWSFNGTDGGYPAGSLFYWRDTMSGTDYLYGTSTTGGTAANCTYPTDCGLVFRVPMAGGPPQTLLAFAGHPNDGGHPYPGLTYWHNPNGTDWLYGVAEEGGPATCPNGLGCGALFRLHP